MSASPTLRDHLPLQQGLRRLYLLQSTPSPSQRPSSTTTRIKTPLGVCRFGIPAYPQRPSSTTTRIKTSDRLTVGIPPGELRDHLPLQQGLRLQSICLDQIHWSSAQRPSSTTTRIKTSLKRMVPGDFFFSETIFHYNKD